MKIKSIIAAAADSARALPQSQNSPPKQKSDRVFRFTIRAEAAFQKMLPNGLKRTE